MQQKTGALTILAVGGSAGSKVETPESESVSDSDPSARRRLDAAQLGSSGLGVQIPFPVVAPALVTGTPGVVGIVSASPKSKLQTERNDTSANVKARTTTNLVGLCGVRGTTGELIFRSRSIRHFFWLLNSPCLVGPVVARLDCQHHSPT